MPLGTLGHFTPLDACANASPKISHCGETESQRGAETWYCSMLSCRIKVSGTVYWD